MAQLSVAPYRNLIQATADQTGDFLAGEPLVDLGTIDRLAAEVSWLAAACRIVAGAVSTHPFDIMRDDETIATENDRAKYPPWLTGYMEGFQRLLYRLAYSWLLHGQAYTWVMGGEITGAPKGLQFLPVSIVQPQIKKRSELTGWRLSGSDQIHPVERIIPYWEPTITAIYGWGPAPAVAAGAAARLLQSLDQAVNVAFANGPIMVTLVGFPEGTPDEDIQAVMADLRDLAAGRGKAGTLFPLRFVGGGANGQPELVTREISIKPKEMAAAEIEDAKVASIAAAVGCTLGILKSDRSHYSIMEAEGINVYEFRATPMFVSICDQINRWLGERTGITLEPQPSRLPCYQAHNLKTAQSLFALTGNRAIMTVAEARVEYGLPAEMPESQSQADKVATTHTPMMPPGDMAPVETRSLPGPHASYEELCESVRLWSRKSKRRGELAEWRSALIPDALRETIRELYGTYGHLTAFSWARSQRTFMDELVAELRDGLQDEFGRYRKAIQAQAATGVIDWAAIGAQYGNQLKTRLATVVTDGMMRWGTKFGPPWNQAVVHTKALEWAQEHAYERGKLFSEATHDIIADALEAKMTPQGMTEKQFEDLLRERLDVAFSDARIEQIAITEVTTAVEASTQYYQEMLYEELGVHLVRRWQYTWSGDRGREPFPCPICEPLNDQLEDADGMWHVDTEKGRLDITGPPAHVRCYCTTGLEMPNGR